MVALPRSTALGLADAVHDALRLWHDDRSPVSPLHDLYLTQRALRQGDANVRHATNQVLAEGLAALSVEHPDDAKLLRSRFLERRAIFNLAADQNVSQSWIYTLQREAITRLTKVIQAAETAARAAPEASLQTRLEPPTYARLIGADVHLARLSAVLENGTAQLVAVTGLGGIGKTALADALLRTLVRRAAFDSFGWVSARQQLFDPGGAIAPVKRPVLTTEALIEALADQLLEDRPPAALSAARATAALQARFQAGQRRYLIVIDNLETVHDVEHLLSVLRGLTTPHVKFLLTSRESLFAEPSVYTYVLSELSENDALELIREEAHQRNVHSLVEAAANALRPIYRCVGGNPLALRLVVGQTHVHALDTVLHDLTAMRGKRAENLYDYIYRRAWEGLDEPARRVLLATLVIPRCALSELCEITGLPADIVCDAVEQLVTRSLVDCRGGLNERHYTIHELTRTFLHGQVVKWSSRG